MHGLEHASLLIEMVDTGLGSAQSRPKTQQPILGAAHLCQARELLDLPKCRIRLDDVLGGIDDDVGLGKISGGTILIRSRVECTQVRHEQARVNHHCAVV